MDKKCCPLIEEVTFSFAPTMDFSSSGIEAPDAESAAGALGCLVKLSTSRFVSSLPLVVAVAHPRSAGGGRAGIEPQEPQGTT